MTKKINLKATTKLSKFAENKSSANDKEAIGIITTKKTKQYPKAFRFTQDDLENLKKITKEANLVSRRHMGETKVIQALLLLGTKIPAKTIVRAFRKVW